MCWPALKQMEDGKNNTNVWKEMRKAFPKKRKQDPTGLRNIDNKTITNPKEKKSVILKHFIHRMKLEIHSPLKNKH